MSTELTTTIKASLDTYKGKFEAKLVEFQKTHKGLVYKMEEEEQRTKARADRREVNKVIKELDDEHDSIKEPFKNAVTIIDATRKQIKDEFLVLSTGIGDQLNAHDEKIQGKLDEISVQAEIDPASASSTLIQSKIDDLTAVQIDDSFCDKKADAALIKEQTLQKLAVLKKLAEDREELERLKKAEAERQAKEREDQIRRDAEEKARKEAEAKAHAEREKADKERAEAEAKAEAERKRQQEESERKVKEAEERAANAAKVERERIEREQREAAAKAETLRKEEEAKKAKQEHRAKIHKQAKESLVKNGIDEKQAVKIVELIRDGEIKNVSIIY